MIPNPESEWWMTTNSRVIADGAEDAVLVLRLGLAVNALRAQHRFSHAVNDSTGPAGARDRIWAFIQAVAFVREGLNILSGTGGTAPQSQRVKELAVAGGADGPLIGRISALQGGSHPAAPMLARVRNQLAFHWDPIVLWPWVAETAAEGADILWMEGIGKTNGETIHRAATDALVNAILPSDPKTSDTPEQRFGAAIPHIADAMDALTRYFDHAVTGYITTHHGVLKRRE